MNNIFTILKKELKRIFTDRRMLLSLILPGILIYVLYSIMGSVFTKTTSVDNDYEYKVYIFNQSTVFEPLNHSDDYKVEITSDFENLEEAKKMLEQKKVDLIVFYEEGFDEKLSQASQEQKPQVFIYYNSTSTTSSTIYSYYLTNLSGNSVSSISYNYFVNAGDENYDLATKEDTSAMIITSLVPSLLMILLFSGCMGVSTESIAGEKERGTISTLLVTPTKRSDIAIGKVLALAIASLVSSVTSFIGLFGSLPKLMESSGQITLSMYNFGTYASILILIMINVIFFTVLLSIISTLAKSAKEASQYAVPVMVVVMMFGMSSLFGGGNSSFWALYLIPIYNSVQCMGAIFSLSFNPLNFIITIVSSLAYIGIGIFALTKMFNSEKIMFNK